MAERDSEGSIPPRRGLGGPIIPPPPPQLAQDSRKAEQDQATAARRASEKQAAVDSAAARRAQETEKRTQDRARGVEAKAQARATKEAGRQGAQNSGSTLARTPGQQPAAAAQSMPGSASGSATKPVSPRRTRRAQLRLVQIDAWSVMKTAFMLSIALGIVLVAATAIIWSVLGAAGVWDSINSIVQQAVGGNGEPFDIRQYVGTSRVLGLTTVIAVLDVILITAIATLGAFLYNLTAALLGGIEVTLAEDP